MLTGQPHVPLQVENANPGAPNNWPTIGAILTHLSRHGEPGASATGGISSQELRSLTLPAHLVLLRCVSRCTSSRHRSIGLAGTGFRLAGSRRRSLAAPLRTRNAGLRFRTLRLRAEVPLGRLETRRSLLSNWKINCGRGSWLATARTACSATGPCRSSARNKPVRPAAWNWKPAPPAIATAAPSSAKACSLPGGSSKPAWNTCTSTGSAVPKNRPMPRAGTARR